MVLTSMLKVDDAETSREGAASNLLRQARQTRAESDGLFGGDLVVESTGQQTLGYDFKIASKCLLANLVEAAARISGALGGMQTSLLLTHKKVGASWRKELLGSRVNRMRLLGLKPWKSMTTRLGPGGVSVIQGAPGDDGFSQFGRALTKNLRKYPSALQVVHMTGHGHFDDHFGGV